MNFNVSISSKDWSSLYDNTALTFTYKLPRKIELSASYEVAVVHFRIVTSPAYKRRTLKANQDKKLKVESDHYKTSYVLCCNIVPEQCVRETLLPAIYEFNRISKQKQTYISPTYLPVQPNVIDKIQFQFRDTTGRIASRLEFDIIEVQILLHFRRLQ